MSILLNLNMTNKIYVKRVACAFTTAIKNFFLSLNLKGLVLKNNLNILYYMQMNNCIK